MLRSFVFGLTLGIAIGPIALLILNFGLTAGWRAGVTSALGSTLADFIYALVAFGAGRVLAPVLSAHRALLDNVAGGALIVIGVTIVASGVTRLRGRTVPSFASVGHRTPFTTSFLLTLVNPMTIIGFAAFGAQLNLTDSWSAVVRCAVAAVAGTFAVSGAVGAAGGALSPLLKKTSATGWLNVASGVAIGWFGVAGLAR